VELVTDRATRTTFDPALKLNERVKRAAYERGLACYPMGGTIDGRHGDHVILAPPYIVTAEQVDAIADRFGEAVEAALEGVPRS
jgi:adenosylmethionine-8-amino-7-oxononanoate aminotransferase